MTPPSPAISGTLIVDPSGKASSDCARSLEEAVSRLIGGEYDTIVVHGRDDAGLVEYLAGTWPEFLRAVRVRRVSADAVDVWDPSRGRFVRERTRRRSAHTRYMNGSYARAPHAESAGTRHQGKL